MCAEVKQKPIKCWSVASRNSLLHLDSSLRKPTIAVAVFGRLMFFNASLDRIRSSSRSYFRRLGCFAGIRDRIRMEKISGILFSPVSGQISFRVYERYQNWGQRFIPGVLELWLHIVIVIINFVFCNSVKYRY